MSDRTCLKCGKAFKAPCHLKRHMQRKTPCAPIVDHHELSATEQAKPFPCRFCGHRFASQPSLGQHMRKNCRIVGSAEGMEKLYEHTLQRQLDEERKRRIEQSTETAELKGQVAELTALLKRQLAIVGPHVAQTAGTINNAPSYSVTANNNITINLFGGEQIQHIGTREVRAVLDKTLLSKQSPLDAALQALVRTATLIYSDLEHPENLTCYIPNKKTDDVMVHGDAGWEIQSCQLILPPMATRGYDILFDKQPFEDSARYGDLMKALRDNEEAFSQGRQMRTVLVRNKDLLEKALGTLPR